MDLQEFIYICDEINSKKTFKHILPNHDMPFALYLRNQTKEILIEAYNTYLYYIIECVPIDMLRLSHDDACLLTYKQVPIIDISEEHMLQLFDEYETILLKKLSV